MENRKPKIPNILQIVRGLFAKGHYLISRHAELRQGERFITLGDIANVIQTGFHESRKDDYKAEFSDWVYAIRGKTLDHEEARICVSLHLEQRVVIVTVIRLQKRIVL